MTEDTSPENLRKFLTSDDPALVRMGLSMAKGSGVSEELLPTILGLYMWDDDKAIRAAAKSIFIKLAPEAGRRARLGGANDLRTGVFYQDAKQAVKENWKASYRIDSYNGHRLGILGKALGQTSVSLVGQLIKSLRDKDQGVRRGAAHALGMIGDARAVEPLIKALKQGRSDTVPFLEKMPPATVGAEYERLELYDDAEEWYTSHGMLEEAAAARRKKAEMGAAKVSQKVVHGDEITKTEIKDSVVSKSNVGGGSSKMQELKELTEMKKEGLITDEEFEKMKRNIIG